MLVVCVDDEKLVLDEVVRQCRQIERVTETVAFTDTGKALAYIEKNCVNIAILDINMPDMNGIELAARIKEISPDTAIIFVTGYSQYAMEAFKLHVAGYLMKPIAKAELEAEIEHALLNHSLRMNSHITVRTFGNFDMFVDGKTVLFGRSKAKELLAYLIEKRGKSVSRLQVFTVLFEDKLYDRSMQKQFDNIIRTLREALKSFGVAEIFVLERGTMRIRPELIDCDMYRFQDGEIEAINAFRGEYMIQYSWASISEAYATRISNQIKKENK